MSMSKPPMTPRTMSAFENAASMRGGFDTRDPLGSSLGFSQRGGLDSSAGFYQARLPPDPPLGREMTPRGMTPRAPDLPRLGGSTVRTSSAKTAFRRTDSHHSQTGRAAQVTGTPPAVSGDYLLPGGLSAYAVDRKVKADASMIFGEGDVEKIHLHGVVAATSALEQDEARHWMKWGCGGKGPTEMLKRLAEELKILFHTLEDGTEGVPGKEVWFPDKRTQRIHEQMLHIASKLARQPPKPPTPPGGPAPTTRAPRTPPSVLKEENIRLRTALTEKQAQVDALENTFAAYVPIKHKAKARDEWLVQYALKGRFLAYDATAAHRSFALWSKVVSKLCVPRKLKVQHAEIVKRELDVGLVALCYNLWRTWWTTVGASSAGHRMMLTVSSWADKTQQEILLHRCYDAWTNDTFRLLLERRLEEAREKATEEKKRLLSKFGEAALAQLRQRINADAATLQQWALSVWVQYLEEVLAERRAKAEEEAARAAAEAARAAAEAAEAKLRQQRLAAAERCFHASARKLRLTSWRGWCDQVQLTRLAKEKLEQGMSRAMKVIMASDSTLKATIVSAWSEFIKEEANKRKAAEIELARRLVENARQRALNMLNKNFTEAAGKLQAMTFGAWSNDVITMKRMRMKKDSAIAAAMRSIATTDKTLMGNMFTPWMDAYKKRVARDRRIDQILKKIGVNGRWFQCELLQKWLRAAGDIKQERLQEEARLRAEAEEERMRQKRLAAAERCFHKSAGKLKGTSWASWCALVSASKAAEKKLQEGLSRAMKAIMSSEIGLKSACITLWSDVVKADRLLRQQRDAEMARQIIAKAREKAMNMLNRNIAKSASALQESFFDGWYTYVKKIKETEKSQQDAMRKAMLKIAFGDKALVLGCFEPWREYRKKRLAREKRIDQVLRSLGVGAKHLQSQVLLKWAAAAREDKFARMEDQARRFREIMEEEARKQREAAEELARKKREEVAERCFGKARRTLLTTSWRGWLAYFDAILEAQKRLEQNMSHAMKAIMSSETGLKAGCIGLWKDIVQSDRLLRQKREAEMASRLIAKARERAIAMLHKNLASTAIAIQQTCLGEWHHFTESVKQMAKRKDGLIAQVMKSLATGDQRLLESILIPWIKGFKAQKARDRRIQEVMNSLGAKMGAIRSEIFLRWCRVTGDLKQERLRQEALDALEEKERQRRLAAAERCFWKTTKTLVKLSWSGWRVEVEITREAQKKLEEGMTKAMRAFMATETTLKADVLQLWLEALRLDLQQRQRAEIETARRLLAGARERAVAMLKKGLAAGAATLMSSSIEEWQSWVARVKKRRGQMTIATLLVEAHQSMLMQFCVGCWMFLCTHSKESNARMRGSVQMTRVHNLQLAQGVVMRLHKRVAVRDPFFAWATRALG